MPVIPSFTGFAPTPNLAQSYLGGVRTAQDAAQAAATEAFRRDQLAQQAAMEAAQEASRMQIAREQIEAEKARAEMEWKARDEISKRSALQKEQDALIRKEYQQNQLGLREREVEAREQQAKMKLVEAADQFRRQQDYERDIANDVPLDQALLRNFSGTPGAVTAAMQAMMKNQNPNAMTASEKNLRYRELTRKINALKTDYWLSDEQSRIKRFALEKEIKDLLQPVGKIPAPPIGPVRTNAPSELPIPSGIVSPQRTQTGTNAPPSAVAPPSAGYKVGAVYKGGLRYLGGDPKDERSWERVR